MAQYGILVKKTILGLNKSLGVNFKDIFKATGKGIADGAIGRIDLLAKDGVDALAAAGLSKDVGHIAWLLIYRSLYRAVVYLVKENQSRFSSKYTNYDSIADQIKFDLEDTEIIIDEGFVRQPKELLKVIKIQNIIYQWVQYYGLDTAQAKTLTQRYSSYFVFSLNKEWHSRRSDYELINSFFNTPVSDAARREQAWLFYNAWLQKQVDEPMFDEVFSLRQVYIEPRAYYEQEIENREYVYKEEKYQKIAVDLATELQAWLNKADRYDAIRMVSGDPGSGKSSFSKMFADYLVETREIPVLFIPLHRFDPIEDLEKAVAKFIRDDEYLDYNPLEPEYREDRLLIIFDGLDELSMQGKLGAEVAKNFLGKVKDAVRNQNYQQTRLQVIISGRPVIVQANENELRDKEQILHILPYLVNEQNSYSYKDPKNLLTEDRRNAWWKKYGEVKDQKYTGIPSELKLENLTEITKQPLLNYLIALSYERSQDQNIPEHEKIVFNKNTNLNAIYQDLLRSVHKRGWDTEQHPALQGVDYKKFVRILEEIALVTWHGDGRTTTVKEIEAHCQNSSLEKTLEIFKKGAESGVTNLLTSFYFRQSGYGNDGEQTFEFTHKSFGEYLTARRIIRELNNIWEELQRKEDDPDKGWDEREALTKWATICGITNIDEYLFEFLLNEMALETLTNQYLSKQYQNNLKANKIILNPKEKVKQWQQILCNLIEFMLEHGMPMGRLNPRPHYKEECRQSRNAEEALLVVLHCCSEKIIAEAKIKWQSEFAFGRWLARLQNAKEDEQKTIILQCLRWLNLEGAYLRGAHLEGAHLTGAHLTGAHLEGANLNEANLTGAHLEGAHLDGANLDGANLNEANLNGANLDGANLDGANLDGANLRGAHFDGANLRGANLDGANLDGANLNRANLRGAYLNEENLYGANLYGANPDEAILD